jgi:hypothetical protein
MQNIQLSEDAVAPAAAAASRRIVRAILIGGSLAAVLDGLDAIVAYRIVLGLDPVQIYQFVASGMLGPGAYAGGAGTALIGVAVHCLVAFGAAAAFTLASVRLPWLVEHAAAAGTGFGLGVFVFMNYVVIPLSLIPMSAFSLPLFVNGVVGHALFVGLPIAFAARRQLRV